MKSFLPKVIYHISVILMSCAILAAESPIVTTTSGYVPPGFENINNDYQGIVTIYYNNKEIGIGDIAFDDHADKVEISQEAQGMITQYLSDIVKPEYINQVRTTLSHSLPANSRLEHYYLARSINANKVSAYYSYRNMHLYLFIPNTWKKNQVKEYKYDRHYTHDIHHTPSLKSAVNVYYEKYNDQHIAWQTIGDISSGNINLTYDVNGQIQGKFNDLYVQYLGKRYTYKAGYQESDHRNIIAPSGNIWGVSLVENPKMINKDFYQAYQAPLNINLSRPYYVTISYRGRTLFNGTLPQGDNIIDTSRFPKGTYTIDITKRDLLSGETTTESQLYYGQAGKYNWLYSGFQIFIGDQAEYFNSDSADRSTYIRISNGYKFHDGEVDLSYIHGQHTNFFGADYNYISTSTFDYGASAYLSSIFDWYFSGNVSYIDGQSRYQAYIRNGYQENDSSSGRHHDIGGTYGYSQDDWDINLNARASEHNSYSVTASVTRTIHTNGVPLRLGFSNNYSDSGNSAILSLQVPFSYQDIQGNTSLSIDDDGDIDLGIGGSIRHENYYLSQNVTLASDSNDTSYSYSNAGYKNQYGELDADVTFTKEHNNISASSVGMSIKTNLLATFDGILFTKDYINTGFFVALPQVDDTRPVYFDINTKRYLQGTNIYVAQPEYSTSRLLISTDSMDYGIDYPRKEFFLLPSNIVSIAPTVSKSCITSFTPDLSGMFTFVGKEDELFGIGMQKTYFQLDDGDHITLKNLTTGEICKTGVVVSCQRRRIDLGKLSCIR